MIFTYSQDARRTTFCAQENSWQRKLVQAARHGARIEEATIYVTASPCWGCFRLIANAGIGRICFGEFYRDPRIFEVATRLGIELVDMSQQGKT